MNTTAESMVLGWTEKQWALAICWYRWVDRNPYIHPTLDHALEIQCAWMTLREDNPGSIIIGIEPEIDWKWANKMFFDARMGDGFMRRMSAAGGIKGIEARIAEARA